jgi:hypothetical protein
MEVLFTFGIRYLEVDSLANLCAKVSFPFIYVSINMYIDW